MSLYLSVGPWPLLQFRNLYYKVGRTPWTSDHEQPVAWSLPTHRTAHTQNKRTHKHPCLEWNSKPRSQGSSERAKTVHALDRAATVIGPHLAYNSHFSFEVNKRFGATCRLHLQYRRIGQLRNQHEADSKQSLAYSSTLKMKMTCSSETSVDF
jgi:hypothetical protein